MNLIVQSLIAGLASGSFTLLYNARPLDAVLGGSIGFIGWFVYSLTLGYGMVASALLAALAIGLVGRILSRLRHIPSQPLIVGGIVVLVPGFMAFKAMNAFVIGNSTQGATMMINVFLIAASIGTGLVVAVAITTIIFRKK
ncbi:MAG: threonine/serine exporter family protein [Thermotogae bacterium]|nr:threonine/serine exporter family protein [Thermotogota bacterium]MCL5032557.1 threonine/serine exporter family protein [Thermotogota bacterium]